jgi:hypothetical protein
MARNPPIPWIVAPPQREHVVGNFDDDALVPTLLWIFLGEDQIADANLVPIPGQVGGRPGWPRPGSTAACSTRRRWRLTEISVRGGGDQFVVQVAANERHEGSTRRMNPADRQPSGNFGDLGVIARQDVELQLGCSFDGETGVLSAKPGRLRLAAAIDAEQNQR